MRTIERDERATAVTRRRYDRIAPIYDLMGARSERTRFGAWRRRLWSEVAGPLVLEVGVGTGRNIPYYPLSAKVTAIDLSPRMLERARTTAARVGHTVGLQVMDAQNLRFPTATFDTVVATFVFCSVPEPIQGLRELKRVTKPEGKIILLEHVRPPGWRGRIADWIDPLVSSLWGAHVNRRTVENLASAGLSIERVDDLWNDLVKLIVARPAPTSTDGDSGPA
jgi:phosphatidylethanolamine/phosphatidyl-N-methylethanolamine N-methyltransferase